MPETYLAEIEQLFPRPLDDEERARAQGLIDRSLDLIDLEFMRSGRDLQMELVSRRDVPIAVRQAVTEMVSRAIHVGESEGRASVTSTTGPQSDSITWSQGIGIQWGGVGIDDSIRQLLGLVISAFPRGGGGSVIPYGYERPRLDGAEFAERRRRFW